MNSRSTSNDPRSAAGANRAAAVSAPLDLVSLLVGEAAAMRELRTQIVRVARSSIPVLIEGPTGAGKELVARAIHSASGRTGPLTALNVSAIAESMFEDALFGHVRGAFTGAVHDAPGYLLEANRGTLFMDEIGSLGLSAQAKLLRVLETREFRPVGGRSDRSSDFRTVAATNEPLARMVTSDRFRTDLFQRLSGVMLHVPALRERMTDLPLLARHLLQRVSASESALTDGALTALESHPWPGNVRELRFVLEHALLLSENGVITRTVVQHALSGGCRGPSGSDFLARRLNDVLETHDWKVKRAASALGVHWTTLYRQIRRLGLRLPGRASIGWPSLAMGGVDGASSDPALRRRGQRFPTSSARESAAD